MGWYTLESGWGSSWRGVLLGSTATPPVTSPIQSVNADGWSAQAASPAAAIGASFTASRQGYVGAVASTITETIPCTARVRLPYPSHATLSDNRIALADYVYSTDTIAGVTNGSAETSPKPVANWATLDRNVVGNTLVAEVVAFHRNARALEQVAAVEFIATDGTTTVSQVVTTSVISGRSGDQNPVVVYRSSLDISTLANPATITLNAQVYPHIGGAASVINSADQSGRREFSPRFYRRDTALAAAPVYVYVAVTGGNDTTGVVGTDAAAAKAAPCATIGGAINRLVAVNGRIDGCIIRLMAGTHALSGAGIVTTRTQDYARLTIERDPAETLANVILQYGGVSFRGRLGAAGGWLTFRDLTFSRVGVTQMGGESASQLEIAYQDLQFNAGSVNASLVGSNADMLFVGVTFSALAGSTLNAGTREVRLLRGCVIPSAPSGLEGWLVLGCTITSPSGSLTTGTRTASGSIASHNRISGVSPTAGIVSLASSTDVVGAAVCQNVIEYTDVSLSPAIRVSADNATGNSTHIIMHHNTFVGFFSCGRANLFYDEGSTPRTNKLMSVRGNIHTQINTKGDVFVTNGARVGNWAYLYGVGCYGEFSQYIDASSAGIGSGFAQAYAGLNANIGTSNSVRNDPLFVDYKGTTAGPTAGAGGGNYALQSGSPAKGIAVATLRFDAAGAARSATTSAGAYE